MQYFPVIGIKLCLLQGEHFVEKCKLRYAIMNFSEKYLFSFIPLTLQFPLFDL